MKPWDPRDYQRQRDRFVQAREHRTSLLGVALVMGVTSLAGWLCSAALRVSAGITSLPLRYALSALLAYAVFFACVRLWAEFQRRVPEADRRSDWADVLELPSVDDGIGCVIVLAVFVVGLVLSAGLWAFGGFAVLLEVAFEVAFAGTVVRSALRPGFVVGRWWQVLLRRTAVPALVFTALLVGLAAVAQHRYPQAQTLGQVLQHWLASR